MTAQIFANDRGTAKPVDRVEAEALYSLALSAQTAFWGCMNELEAALGIDLDGTADLADTTVDELLTEATKERH